MLCARHLFASVASQQSVYDDFIAITRRLETMDSPCVRRSVFALPALPALLLLSWLAGGSNGVRAEVASFDLAGPTLVVTVGRGQSSLPIDQVPSLAPGDSLSLRAEFTGTQSAHYLMVLAFLRGATDPPPASWFHPCETWKSPCATQGLHVTVPAGAQQAVILLAPATGGDLRTIRSALQGRPGAFVHASLALNQASLDRSRLEVYLGALRQLDHEDRDALRATTPLLARSLAVKVDEHCLDRIPELQASCLMQGQEALILSDGHSASLVDTLTSGPSADLALVAASTPTLGAGTLGPYVASILDIGRIFSALSSAQYQYIPALAIARQERLQLNLNTPPSFHNPLSVLVSSLPPIEPGLPPTLHAPEPIEPLCAASPTLVAPVEGAPLVFSTHFAHDMRLRLESAGKKVELPAVADARRGGYVVSTADLQHAGYDDVLTGILVGRWGFDPFQGPAYSVVVHPSSWILTDGEEGSLVAGRDDTVRLSGNGAACLTGFTAHDAVGNVVPTRWKRIATDQVEVTLSLQGTVPGSITLQPSWSAATAPAPLELRSYADVVRLDSLAVSPTDMIAVAKGNRLDAIERIRIGTTEFVPQRLIKINGGDELTAVASSTLAADVAADPERYKAKVHLNGGRTLSVSFAIAAPRPVASLLHKSVERSNAGSAAEFTLSGADEVAPDETLTFSVRLNAGATFTAQTLIDVQTLDHRVIAELSPGHDVTLANTQLAVARLRPASLLGPLGFGPLQFRVATGAVASEWQPLATVVRVPDRLSVECPDTSTCRLRGTSLFLLAQVRSADGHSISVPEGYTEDSLAVPYTDYGKVSFTLRDDPAVLQTLRLPKMSAAATHAPDATSDAHHAPETSDPEQPSPN